MQKFSVATKEGLVHTTDFESARKVLKMEFERKKAEQELQQQFASMLEDYTPKTKEGILRQKYGDNPLENKIYKI